MELASQTPRPSVTFFWSAEEGSSRFRSSVAVSVSKSRYDSTSSSSSVSRASAALFVSLFFLGRCSDTERSWAYTYRYKFEEPTVTPRVSTYHRTKEECKTQLVEFSRFQVALDRCVLQPPISLGWIEWETSIEIKAQAPKEPISQERMSFITQNFSDCRKVRHGLRRCQTTSAHIIFGDAADGWCSSSRHGSDGARG